MEMICLMHEAEPYGTLMVNGTKIDERSLGLLVGIDVRTVKTLLRELENFKVFERDTSGAIFSKRMRRDYQRSQTYKANGKAGGNPILLNQTDKPEDNVELKPLDKPSRARVLEARSQIVESKKERETREDAPRDVRADLFSTGLKLLEEMTGKTPNSCRAFLGKCLKLVDDEAIQILGAIEETHRNRIADPISWILANIKPRQHIGGRANGHKIQEPRSVQQAADDLHQRIAAKHAEWDAVFGPSGDGSGEGPPRLLPQG